MIPYQMHEDPNEEEDLPQQAVNNLLSRELLQLSIKDRTAIQEEIHGVACLAPEETPQLLENSLLELALTLESDDLIPPHKKRAYMRSQQYVKSFVNNESFRLRFLRFTLFNAKKAAEKIVQFLDVAAELFGEFALQRAVQLSDFDNHDLKYLREGEFQFLPFRDRSGRRILAVMNPLMPREDPVSTFYGYQMLPKATQQDTHRLLHLPSFSFWFLGIISVPCKDNALHNMDSR